MAEEEAQEEAKSGGLGGMIMMVALVVSAIGAGLALPFVVNRLVAAPTEVVEETPVEPEIETEVDFINFDEVTVNLATSRFSRFLQLKFSLQVAKSQKDEIEKLVTEKELIFKNWIQMHMSEKAIEDLQGPGRSRVRRELLDLFNSTLFDDGIERIQEVLIEEFKVQ